MGSKQLTAVRTFAVLGSDVKWRTGALVKEIELNAAKQFSVSETRSHLVAGTCDYTGLDADGEHIASSFFGPFDISSSCIV